MPSIKYEQKNNNNGIKFDQYGFFGAEFYRFNDQLNIFLADMNISRNSIYCGIINGGAYVYFNNALYNIRTKEQITNFIPKFIRTNNYNVVDYTSLYISVL